MEVNIVKIGNSKLLFGTRLSMGMEKCTTVGTEKCTIMEYILFTQICFKVAI